MITLTSLGGAGTVTGSKHLLAASGVATVGRVPHHIKAFGSDRRNTILVSGFQAAGARGRSMVEGAAEVKVYGQWIPVRDDVANLPAAHPDLIEFEA